ncbi:uncharacterized protein [Dendrobates tinctorius]|uniref:uncharacterized protein isoform X2 n=1 Tax=Dendrobates tinctorius TaxID=92724 RepID=UPI003CCA12E9
MPDTESAGDHARHRERRRPCQTPRAPETMPDTESAGDHARHRERRRPCQTPRAPETMPDTESAGDFVPDLGMCFQQKIVIKSCKMFSAIQSCSRMMPLPAFSCQSEEAVVEMPGRRAPDIHPSPSDRSLPGKQTTAAVYLVRIELNLTRIMRQV